MAFPTSVNDQITDSVTQANTKVLGDAPAIAMGNLYQATAQALANTAHNATNAQQQSYVTALAERRDGGRPRRYDAPRRTTPPNARQAARKAK
ncbi:hypothetical protein BMMON2_40370 [Burkholderia mallei]